ncbi:Dabb family protein [Pseudomonas sp. R2.Fl]|nr:Dabb family protein [Pseudomonas sp. R2.Fl]
MILHNVFLRFKAAVADAEKQSIYAEIEALREDIPGIVDFHHGANVSPEGLSSGYNDGFVVTFEDAEVRDYYLAHPKHRAVSDRIVNATDGGLSGILVFDMEI